MAVCAARFGKPWRLLFLILLVFFALLGLLLFFLASAHAHPVVRSTNVIPCPIHQDSDMPYPSVASFQARATNQETRRPSQCLRKAPRPDRPETLNLETLNSKSSMPGSRVWGLQTFSKLEPKDQQPIEITPCFKSGD